MLPAESLVPNFSWVLPGRLAGSGLPGRTEPRFEADAYRAIHDAGVRLVVSLLERPPPSALLARAGLDSLHFPIDDFGTPRDVEGFGRLVDEVHARIDAGAPALVHCYAGMGRTGMFLAVYLARHGGLAPDAALRELRRLRPFSVETAGQRWVLSLLAAP